MKFAAVIVGDHITAHRRDGRDFFGKIVNVRALTKGTLVTIRQNDIETYQGFSYKSFYLEDLTSWDCDRDGQYLAEVYSL